MASLINFLLLKKNRVNSLMVFYIVQMYYFLFLLHISFIIFLQKFLLLAGLFLFVFIV